MSKTVVILGAKGRFGRAAVTAFTDAGWHVRAFARSWSGPDDRANVELVAGDAFDPHIVAASAQGRSIIVNALNPPYPRWQSDLPKITAAVIMAAEHTGATVMLPGNIYGYGASMPELLTEATNQTPTVRKGRFRLEMEKAYAGAAEHGVKTVILRGGDFIERETTGNWFDSHITANVAKGVILYPGPLDRAHTWAYLPDMARAMVGLAETRDSFGAFEQFGFAGYSLSGRALIEVIEQVVDRGAMKIKSAPWALIRTLGLLFPQMREIAEMAYLWQVPHTIEGTKLFAALPGFEPTPLDRAIADALGIDGC